MGAKKSPILKMHQFWLTEATESKFGRIYYQPCILSYDKMYPLFALPFDIDTYF